MANEKRLIAESDIYKLFGKDGFARLHVGDIGTIPRVDAVEVVHGRWLIDEYEYYDCSVCGESYFNGCDSRKEAEERLRERPYDVYAYCPYCGARMDGDGNA